MPFTVTETIHHGSYRSVRTMPFRGNYSELRSFLAECPYPISDDATDAMGLPVSKSRLDYVTESAFHALSIGRAFEHGWARYTVTRDDQLKGLDR